MIEILKVVLVDVAVAAGKKILEEIHEANHEDKMSDEPEKGRERPDMTAKIEFMDASKKRFLPLNDSNALIATITATLRSFLRAGK